MISPETLAVLRCPMDSRRETTLVLEDDVKLFCSRCRVQYKTKEGLPILIIDEAILPEGCEAIDDLPCRSKSSKA